MDLLVYKVCIQILGLIYIIYMYIYITLYICIYIYTRHLHIHPLFVCLGGVPSCAKDLHLDIDHPAARRQNVSAFHVVWPFQEPIDWRSLP